MDIKKFQIDLTLGKNRLDWISMNKRVKQVKLDNERRDWKGVSRPCTKFHSTKKGKRGYDRKSDQSRCFKEE